MAKLLKLRRGTTSQHGSFTGAEGEVTIDTDKETAVVHDGSTAGGHALAKENMVNVSSASIAGRFADDAINPSKIAGGTLGTDVKVADGNINGNLTIENADVTNTAAIAGTKISPNFGSQNIVTTGNLTASGNVTMGEKLTISATTPNIEFSDTNNDPDYRIKVDSGGFTIEDAGDNSDKLVITSNAIDAKVNLDAEAGVDVTGNITVTGTVDGRDVAQDGGKIDELYGGSNTLKNTVNIANGVTATTQSAGDNSTKVATTAYTDTAITNLVDSSPSALNTLNELAAAIGDDASFSTTVTNNIATKMPLAGGEFTGNVTSHSINPDGNNTRSLGTSSLKWHQVHATNFYGNGSNLTGIEAFVTGMILLWSGAANAIPSGFVLCDGNNSTPDLRNRFVVGAGNSYSVGASGGVNTVTLGTSEIPAHSHSTDNHSHSFDAGNHTHSFSGSGSSSHSHSFNYQLGSPPYHSNANMVTRHPMKRSYTELSQNTGNATVSLTVSGNTGNGAVSGNTGNANPSTNNTGGGSAHENRPPYYALCYIMKT